MLVSHTVPDFWPCKKDPSLSLHNNNVFFPATTSHDLFTWTIHAPEVNIKRQDNISHTWKKIKLYQILKALSYRSPISFSAWSQTSNNSKKGKEDGQKNNKILKRQLYFPLAFNLFFLLPLVSTLEFSSYIIEHWKLYYLVANNCVLKRSVNGLTFAKFCLNFSFFLVGCPGSCTWHFFQSERVNPLTNKKAKIMTYFDVKWTTG